MESRYVKIADDVLPTVVEVISHGLQETDTNKWYDYFKDQEENRRENYDSNGIGSGVIVESRSNEYYIITNNHVVGDLKVVTILLSDKSSYLGEVIGVDPRFDLAVVKIKSTKPLPVAKIYRGESLKVGQFVAALGSPMGYVQSISMGVISNIGRFGGPKNNISNFIQTDASINQGNSGGPLVNLKGEVIGINTWISSPNGGSVGLGFSMPINNLYPSFRSIVNSGEIKKSWIGISAGLIPKTGFYKDKKGAFVYQVVLGSPAYEIGIKPGDIITSLNGIKVLSSKDLILKLSLLKPNDNIQITLERSLEVLQKSLTLDMAGDNVLDISKNITPGLILKESDSGLVLLEVLSKSVGQKSGFQKDDKIVSINEIEVNKIEDLYKEIKKGPNKVVITREERELELELNY